MMSSRQTTRHLVLTWLVGAAFALALGNTGCCPDGSLPPCPGNGDGVTTLVDEVFNDTPITRNFNPKAAGKLITATVSGDVTGTRISVTITDFGTGNVVASQPSPTTNATTVTFTSTSNGVHVLQANRIAGPGSTAYTVLVTEQ